MTKDYQVAFEVSHGYKGWGWISCGYVDSDLVEHIDSKHVYAYTRQYCDQLGLSITKTPTKPDYVAIIWASKKIVWLETLMRKVDFLLDGCAVIVKSVIHLARNSTFHQRTKQIDAKHHFICTLLKVWKSVQEDPYQRKSCTSLKD